MSCRYTGPDFQEGVSLTYMDEVIKFKKFAYVSDTCSTAVQVALDAAAMLAAVPHMAAGGWQPHSTAGCGWCTKHSYYSTTSFAATSCILDTHVAGSACCDCVPQGACEILFNPLKLWLTKGPFNKLFVDYIFNEHIKWYQKVSTPAWWQRMHRSGHRIRSRQLRSTGACCCPGL